MTVKPITLYQKKKNLKKVTKPFLIILNITDKIQQHTATNDSKRYLKIAFQLHTLPGLHITIYCYYWRCFVICFIRRCHLVQIQSVLRG